MGGDGRPQGEGGWWSWDGDGLEEGLGALEWAHGHVGGDGRPRGEGGDGYGDEVGHGGGLEALEWAHGHVGGDGRPEGEGMSYTLRLLLELWFCRQNSDFVVRIAFLSSE